MDLGPICKYEQQHEQMIVLLLPNRILPCEYQDLLSIFALHLRNIPPCKLKE